MRGYRDLAEELRRRIDSGEFVAGSSLPRIVDLIDEYGLSRQTVRDAVGLLADEGLVVTMGKGGTVIRHRDRVRICVNWRPGALMGPWETACAQQGLDGQMRVMNVSRGPAPADVEAVFHGDHRQYVHRRRHAMIGDEDVVQIQDAWYPTSVAEQAGLTGRGKAVGGAWAALAAGGFVLARTTQQVISRPPTSEEASELRIAGKVPVLAVQRSVSDAEGHVLEVWRMVTPADRIELTYEDLPLTMDAPSR